MFADDGELKEGVVNAIESRNHKQEMCAKQFLLAL
jgi:hypothetical protein